MRSLLPAVTRQHLVNTHPFSNTYVELGEKFYEKIPPQPVEAPGLIAYNRKLGDNLGFFGTDLDADDNAAVFAGNRVPEGAEPLAMAYAGHQFGNFVAQLGDGRALLLGQVTAADGQQYDIHLKGSGRTLFSRGGDGRSALGPVLREYLLCEAMHRLGVPTTRALAAATTGEQVARQRLLPGGVITRVARSFVRVGTFEYFSARGDLESARQLADYVIAYNYPGCRDANNPYLALLETVVDRQAALIAQWMQLGFIHGVMNTDNMSIAGETIDYGPCAFMDHYVHDKVYSSIDRHGRYAYNNQPNIGLWNLTRLAETLLPLLDANTDRAVDMAKGALENHVGLYASYWLDGMRAKTGLAGKDDKDIELVNDLFELMHAAGADFTLTFRFLSQLNRKADSSDKAFLDLFNDVDANTWLSRWRSRLAQENGTDAERKQRMQAVNPVYIPRNHQVEAAIRAAEDHDDFSVFNELHAVLQDPFRVQEGKERYMQPPAPDEIVQQTFCGT